MVNLQQKLLKTVDKARGLAGKLGFRQFSVDVVTESPGAVSALMGGSPVTTVVTRILQGKADNLQNPLVRELTVEDYRRGAHPDATLEVGPLTPTFTDRDNVVRGVDFSFLEQLEAEKGTVVYYVIDGPGYEGGIRFTKVQFKSLSTLGYTIQLKRV